MLYGAVVWDPVLIISQILSLQCLFYLTLGLFDAILLGPFVGHLSVADIFGWQSLGIYHLSGWMNISANLAAACLGAVYLMWIVERAKKCLDFASTVYIIHFISCWIYSGFPASLVWWAMNVIGLLIMALVGEWLCVQRELADIPLNAMRGRVDAMRGGDAPGAASSSGAGAAGSGNLGSGRAGGSSSLVVEMSSSSGLRAVTTTTRLLGNPQEDSGR